MRLLFVVLILFNFISVYAVNYYTSQDGSWSAATTWVSNNKPGTWFNNGDTVFINHNITLNQNFGFAGALIISSGSELVGARNIQANSNSYIEVEGTLEPNDLTLNSGNLLNDGGNIVVGNNLTINGTGQLINTGYLEVGNNFTNNSNSSPGLNSSGNMMVINNFTNNGNGSVNFTSSSQLNVGNNLTNNSDAVFDGNVYVDNDFIINGGTSVDVGASGIIEVNNSFTNHGNDFTINGALAVNNGGTNTGNIDGSGLLQIDGGYTNWGSIAGNLDVCSSDASTNPINTGNGVSGGASVCSNSGINFPITTPAPLPVDLLSFNAKITQNNQVELAWVTASELNNDFFTIERSNEDLNFIAIEYIPGAGTTNEIKKYNYPDKEPIEGKSYYRLKQTDFDGKSETFDMVSVVFESEAEIEVVLYPNPSNGSDNIFLKVPSSEGENFNVLINDLLGRDFISDLTFIEQNDHTLIIIDFDKQLPKGYYLINIVIKGEIITKKLVVE